MTITTISTDEANRLFTVMRDSSFSWRAADLPVLTKALDWTIAEEIPGDGAIATTTWDIPDGVAEFLYSADRVLSITISVTGPNAASDQDRDTLQDAFANLSSIGKEILGEPSATFPGRIPRIRWRGDISSITMQRNKVAVMIVWATNEHQDDADEAGQM